MSGIPSKPKRQVGLSIAERLDKYRVIKGECWESSLDPKHQYPQIKINGHKLMIHRLAYTEFRGPILEGMHVLHTCDNPRCHRPSHLFLGTARDNMRDMAAKGRHRAGPKTEIAENMIVNLGSTLSQTEIAECMGVSQTVISKILRANGASRGKTTSFRKDHGRGGPRK